MVLQDRFRVSQRCAFRLAGQNRNTHRRPVRVAAFEEQKLRRLNRELASRQVRWGRRLVYRRLRLEGWSVNHKRVQRIWREETCRDPCHASGNAPGLPALAESCCGLNTLNTPRLSTSSSIRRWMAARSSSSTWLMNSAVYVWRFV
jgi:hypothetical protein